MSDPAKQAAAATEPVCHCLEQAVPRERREFLRTAGRAAALVGIAWLGGGVILRSWNTPQGTACSLADACGDCAQNNRCEYPEIRKARQPQEST